MIVFNSSLKSNFHKGLINFHGMYHKTSKYWGKQYILRSDWARLFYTYNNIS